MAVGGIVLAVVMLVILPVAVMVAGAIWSMLMGWLLVDDADARAQAPARVEEAA